MPEARDGRDEVRISNQATYWPVAPLDVVVGARLVGRIVLGATSLGGVVQGVAFGIYLGSGLRDWSDRRRIRRIDFRREFGADVGDVVAMPREIREAEVRTLVRRLNDEVALERVPRRELAVEVDRALTSYIAGITGQLVRTSAAVRDFALVGLAFPFAVGACDMLSGDVAIFRDTGPLEAHVLAHEFSHRKGYWKELHAQVLAYLALVSSGEPVLRQSALLERLHRNLRALAGEDRAAFDRLVRGAGLRPELRAALMALQPPSKGIERQLDAGLRRLYHLRMRLTGQAGISDYDLGFTNFLYTFETSASARQTGPPAGTLHRRSR
jgi:Protein of unknown function (DUF3810)